MSYEKFTTNYYRYIKTPRTWSEATRNADYASPITIYPSPFKRELAQLSDFLVFISLLILSIGSLLLLVQNL